MAEKAIKAIKLTDNGTLVLGYMQDNPGQEYGDVIALALGLDKRGIHGVMNSLVKNKLVDKTEPQSREVTDAEGKVTTKQHKAYFLTDLGTEFAIAE